MKRKDILVIGVILAACLAILLASGRLRPAQDTTKAEAYLRITAPDSETELVALDGDREIVIDGADGAHNVVTVFRNGFRMKEASCKNQECIGQGEVTTENLDSRALYNQVICLPNKVVLELVTEDAETLDVGGETLTLNAEE